MPDNAENDNKGAANSVVTLSEAKDLAPERESVSMRRARPLHLALAALAAIIALGAAMVGNARGGGNGTIDVAALARDIEREADHVTALELALWIKDRKPGLRVLDVRTDSEFTEFHIPNAEHMPLNALATLHPRSDETLVLYSEGGAHAAQGWVLLRALGASHVYFLRGGLLDWMDDVMSPVRGAQTDSVWTSQATLSRYFGGVPRAGATPSPPSTSPGDNPAAAPSAGSVVAKLKRRGC